MPGFPLGSVVSVGSVQGGTFSKGSRQVSVDIRTLSCALLALNSVVCLWRRRCRTCQKGQASSILCRRRMKRRMAFTIRGFGVVRCGAHVSVARACGCDLEG